MFDTIEEKAILIATGAIALGALSRLTREQVAQILDRIAADIRSGDLTVDAIRETPPN